VTVNGKRYREYPRRCSESARCSRRRSVHRTGLSPTKSHLLSLAQTHGSRASVFDIFDRVGLQEVARKRVGLLARMGQRLGIAAALLADPRS